MQYLFPKVIQSLVLTPRLVHQIIIIHNPISLYEAHWRQSSNAIFSENKESLNIKRIINVFIS